MGKMSGCIVLRRIYDTDMMNEEGEEYNNSQLLKL